MLNYIVTASSSIAIMLIGWFGYTLNEVNIKVRSLEDVNVAQARAIYDLQISNAEIDRTQEGVLKVLESHSSILAQTQQDIHDIPNRVKDRWTGKEAAREKFNLLRELDLIHKKIGSHQHYHSDVIHEEKE